MKKRNVLISLAALGLLFSGLVGCNKTNDGTSAKPSTPSSQKPSSSKTPSSSKAPVHVHSYAKVGESVKNADEKDVYLMECADKDDKYIGIAFDDFSEKSADFGSTSSYTDVPEDVRAEAHLLAKNSTVSWKVNVDKAIENVKLAFYVDSTWSSHSDSTASDGGTMKYSVQVNDGAFADWDIGDKTYGDLGLSPTERIYVVFQTINLAAGENVITLRQNNAGYRLLFSGEVRMHFTGDAVPVAAPAPVVVPEGYNVTFVGQNCSVLIYQNGLDNDPVPGTVGQTIDGDSKDAALTKYVAPDPENGIAEVKPEMGFKIVADEGFYADGNNVQISGTMGQEWNKLCSEGEDMYNITKIKADITVTITAVTKTGNETKGYAATFTGEHCTIKVYQGEIKEGTALDEADANGKYYSRVKKGSVSKAKAQFNFEVIPDENYEFVPGFTAAELDDGVSPALVPFTTGSYGNFKGNLTTNIYSITKVATDLTVNIVCTPVAAA